MGICGDSIAVAVVVGMYCFVTSAEDTPTGEAKCVVVTGDHVMDVLSCLGIDADGGLAYQVQLAVQFGDDFRTVLVDVVREEGLFAPDARFSVDGRDVTADILGLDIFTGEVLPDDAHAYDGSWVSIEVFYGDTPRITGSVSFGSESLAITTDSENGILDIVYSQLSAAELEHRQRMDTIIAGRLHDDGTSVEMLSGTGEMRARRGMRVQRDLADTQTCKVFLDADASFLTQWGGTEALSKMTRAVLYAKGRFADNFGSVANVTIAGAIVGDGLDAPQPDATDIQILEGYSAYLARGATFATGTAPDRRPGGGTPSQDVCQNILFTHTSTFGASVVGLVCVTIRCVVVPTHIA